MASVLLTFVNELKKVLNQEKKPLGAHNALVRDIKNELKVQVRIAQKFFLEICLKKDLFTKDILTVAKNLAKDDVKKFKKEAR